MREILFRGKRVDNGKWVYGDLAHFPDKTNIDPHEHGQPWRGYAVDPDSIGQYTGLTDKTDKNGKRIFEGDIVTGLFLFGLSVKAVVTFKDGAFGLEWYRGDVKTFNAFTSICNVEYEVIGNIHDNPELIKGGE